MRTRQEVKDINYTAATIASRALIDAQGEIWTATGDYIEFKSPSGHLERAESLIVRALEEIKIIKEAIKNERV